MKGTPLNILCTRPLDEALVRLAAGNNIRIDVQPFICTEPVRDADLKNSVLEAVHTNVPVVFTSSNAVSATAALLNGIRLQNRIYCLSGATQQSVLRHWSQAQISATATDAASLAGLILEEKPVPEKVLFFCGDLHRPELPDALEKAGIGVQKLIVYRTLLLAQKQEQAYDAVLFFSPSAVHSYLQHNDPCPDTVFFAIGATTAAAIAVHGHTAVVSENPDAAALVQRMIHYFSSRTAEGREP